MKITLGTQVAGVIFLRKGEIVAFLSLADYNEFSINP